MMKRIIAIVLVIMLLSISVVFGAEAKTGKAYEGTPVIDAVVDAVWRDVPVMNDYFHSGEKVMHVDTDIQPSMRAMWDADNFYILMEVKDKAVLGEASGEDGGVDGVESLHNNDGFELYLDADNAKSILYQPDDRNIKFDYKGKYSVIKGPKDGIKVSAKKTSDGYIIEASVAWTMAPKAGNKVGFDVAVNDNQDGTGRATWITWSDPNAGAWNSPSAMGVLELVKSTVSSSSSNSGTTASTTDTQSPKTGDEGLSIYLATFLFAVAGLLLYKKNIIFSNK